MATSHNKAWILFFQTKMEGNSFWYDVILNNRRLWSDGVGCEAQMNVLFISLTIVSGRLMRLFIFMPVASAHFVTKHRPYKRQKNGIQIMPIIKFYFAWLVKLIFSTFLHQNWSKIFQTNHGSKRELSFFSTYWNWKCWIPG